MTNRFFFLLSVFFVFCTISAGSAFAQRCATDYEAIFKLRDPGIGAYNIWDGVHGEMKKDERYSSGLLRSNGHVIAVGERSDANGKDMKLLLAEVDRRGRTIWEKVHEITGLQSVDQILQQKNQMVVLANIKDEKGRNSAWIGFFDFEGTLKTKRSVRASRGSLLAHSIVSKRNGAGFLLVGSVQADKKQPERYSEFYNLNSKGQVISKRSYQPGPDNRLLFVGVAGETDYVVSGYIRDSKDRRTGWVMRIKEDGGVIWQQQYPRGAGADLRAVRDFIPGFLVAGGNAFPSVQDQNKAGWVMAISERNGEIGWQRYFTGEFDYAVRDVLVSADGLISALLDGDPPPGQFGPDVKDYVRLVVLNPRGVIFESNEYFNGEAADAFSMILGPSQERIVMGESDMAYQIEGQDEGEEMQVERSREAWILAAPGMDVYEDPCRPKTLRGQDPE